MKFQAIWSRFWKGFSGGALAAITIFLSQTHSVSSLADLKNLLLGLAGAAISGGFLAAWKYLAWKE